MTTAYIARQNMKPQTTEQIFVSYKLKVPVFVLFLIGLM